MRRALLLGCILGSACAPPEPIRDIQILFPTPETDEIEVDTDGILQSLIVVDIDGFDVLPEGDADPSSETEGHWHVYVNNRYKAAVSDGLTFELSDAGHAPGDQISITVALAHDNHDEISDADGRIDNTIELVAVGVGELSE